MALSIKLNNREEVLDTDVLSVSELLQLKNFTFRMLVVKVNGKLIKKTDYDSTMICNGDDVIVLHLISGG